jgi:Protein of unknown function (DUF 659)
LFCQPCSQEVGASKRFQVTRHLETAKHKAAVQRQLKGKQLLVSSRIGNSKLSQFSMDLCSAFVAADIPLTKLEHPKLRSFLETYCKEPIPQQTTLRKAYIDRIYEETMERIRKTVENKKIWISIDETIDCNGRMIANVVIGVLSEEDNKPPIFLLNTEELEAKNHSTIANLFMDSLKLLGENFSSNNVLIFLTDGARYMLKAAKALQVIDPKLIHVTCLAHALNLVAETVRGNFPKVDRLIAQGKKIFRKCPSRTLAFQEMAKGIPLPPRPVVTRWGNYLQIALHLFPLYFNSKYFQSGTWLEAVKYYAENLEDFKRVVDTFDPQDSSAVKACQKTLRNSHLPGQLASILAHYYRIKTAIIQLEGAHLSLESSLKIIEELEDNLPLSGGIAEEIRHRLKLVLSKNSGYQTMINISKVLAGEPSAIKLTPAEISLFKFAPVTSCDVERSFSVYKTFLAPNRQSFIFDNIKKYLVIRCNAE